MTLKSLLTFLVFVTFNAKATDVWNPDVIRFEDKAPTLLTCFYDKTANRSVYFDWKLKEHFRRKIGYRISPVPACKDSIFDFSAGRLLPESYWSTGILEGKAVPAMIQQQLRLIQKGASVLDRFNETSPFLKLEPNVEYTKTLNRELTEKYGAEFSSLTFENWVNGQVKNQRPRSIIYHRLKNTIATLKKGQAPRPYPTTKKTIFLVALGLGWEDDVAKVDRPASEKSVTALIDQAGYTVEYLQRDPQGTIEANGQVMAKSIHAHLSKGENVILIGLSKGTPDVLIGAAIASRKLPENSQALGFGRILGVISFSGISNGTFLSEIPNNNKLVGYFARVGSGVPFFSGFAQTITSLEYLDENFVKKTLKKYTSSLPKKAVYLDLCGISSEFGLPVEKTLPEISKLTKLLHRFHRVRWANDGMAEYPVHMPKNLSSTQYTLAVRGSHYILDGKFDDIDLRLKVSRDALLKAVIGAFLQLYIENYGQI